MCIRDRNYTQNSISVLLGSTTAPFEAALNYPADFGARAVGIADLDADGHSDLAVANAGASTLMVLINQSK